MAKIAFLDTHWYPMQKDEARRAEITIIIISTTRNYCNNLPASASSLFFVLVHQHDKARDNYLLRKVFHCQKTMMELEI